MRGQAARVSVCRERKRTEFAGGKHDEHAEIEVWRIA